MVDISGLNPRANFAGFAFLATFRNCELTSHFSEWDRNWPPNSVLTAMDNNDLQARTEQALVVVTLSTATLIACFGLLVSSLN